LGQVHTQTVTDQIRVSLRKGGAGMSIKGIEHPAEWLETTIRDFINESPENTLQNEGNEKAWADPLVGFSRGDDPLYQEYKEKIGTFYWTPSEIFNETFPGLKVEPDQLTIMSWVLPHVEATKSDNRMQSVYPSERWARARIYGEEVNAKLRRHVVTTLQGSGFEAVAPMLSPQWARKTSERYGFASTWSERHTAYASGLGTFGLCDGLITSKGKAMRVGSVVARIQIPSTPRPYTDHHAYCLFFTHKVKCQKHIRPATADYVESHYGFNGYGCGLCQTKVPCESKIPAKQDVEMYEPL
jgi:hypothetical protein